MCVLNRPPDHKPRLLHAIVDQDDDGGGNNQCN